MIYLIKKNGLYLLWVWKKYIFKQNFMETIKWNLRRCWHHSIIWLKDWKITTFNVFAKGLNYPWIFDLFFKATIWPFFKGHIANSCHQSQPLLSLQLQDAKIMECECNCRKWQMDCNCKDAIWPLFWPWISREIQSSLMRGKSYLFMSFLRRFKTRWIIAFLVWKHKDRDALAFLPHHDPPLYLGQKTTQIFLCKNRQFVIS